MGRRVMSRFFVYFWVRLAIRETAEECEKFVEYVKRIEAAAVVLAACCKWVKWWRR